MTAQLNKLLLPFFLFISLIGSGQLEKSGQPYKGLQAARDTTGKFWLLNKHDVKVIAVDSLDFNVTEVLEKIHASAMPSQDKQLIKRIMDAAKDENKKQERLFGLSRNFAMVDPIVMESLYNSLLLKYGKRKVKKMLKRKE